MLPSDFLCAGLFSNFNVNKILLDGLNPRAQPYKCTFMLYYHASSKIHINCLASVHINDNSTSRLTGYEPGVLPSTRRDTTASSGMLTGHQHPLWMFARLRGINIIDDLRIMIDAFHPSNQPAIRNQPANNQLPRISWTIHCTIGWNTRYLKLIPR
jgi:hypothetical protein